MWLRKALAHSGSNSVDGAKERRSCWTNLNEDIICERNLFVANVDVGNNTAKTCTTFFLYFSPANVSAQIVFEACSSKLVFHWLEAEHQDNNNHNSSSTHSH